MPPWPPRKCVFCSYLCVLVSVGGHMSLWSRCAVCSPPPAATRDESCVGGGWGSDAGGLWRISELATCLYGGQVTGRSPFMEVTDVQGDVHQCVCVCVCVWDSVCVSSFLFSTRVFFFFFALIKLDLPVDENVHLNVNTHISRPPVKYGDLAESFRCQPSFYIFTLVMNGTSLCLLSRFKGKVSSCQVNIQIRRCRRWVFFISFSPQMWGFFFFWRLLNGRI